MADSCVEEHQMRARLHASERAVAELSLQLGVLLGDGHHGDGPGNVDRATGVLALAPAPATAPARSASIGVPPGPPCTPPPCTPPPPAANPPPDRTVGKPSAHHRAGAYRWGFPRAAEQLRLPQGELTLGGVVATALVCWGHVRGRDCDGGCGRAHVCGGACPKALNAALGTRVGKRCAGQCRRPHPTTPDAQRELDIWWRDANRPGGSITACTMTSTSF